jgi:hypothetical protein
MLAKATRSHHCLTFSDRHREAVAIRPVSTQLSSLGTGYVSPDHRRSPLEKSASASSKSWLGPITQMCSAKQYQASESGGSTSWSDLAKSLGSVQIGTRWSNRYNMKAGVSPLSAVRQDVEQLSNPSIQRECLVSRSRAKKGKSSRRAM